MPSRARLAEAGLGAVHGITLGIGSFTFLVLALAIDLCGRGRNAFRELPRP
jgi:hypothetical protein